MRKLALAVAACFVLLAVFTPLEVPVELLLGWPWFLARVLPGVTIDRASLAVGVGAAVLFTLGVHRLGRAWYRQAIVMPASAMIAITGIVWMIQRL